MDANKIPQNDHERKFVGLGDEYWTTQSHVGYDAIVTAGKGEIVAIIPWDMKGRNAHLIARFIVGQRNREFVDVK